MPTVEQQVGRARRRLIVNLFMRWAALGVLIAAGAWTASLLVERLFVLGLPIWHGLWAAGLAALLIAAIGTTLGRVNPFQAAVAIDQAAGLRERLSTALAVARDPDPFARAVVDDAEKIAGRLHVPAHIRYQTPALLPWSAACMAAAGLLAFFMPTLNLLANQPARQTEQQRTQVDLERRDINVEIEARLNRIKEMAENNPALKDLAADLKPIEAPQEPLATPEDIRREAAKRLDKVAERLSQEKENPALDASRDLQRALSSLPQQPGQSPTSDLSKALASGDFEGARKALEEMQKDVSEAAAKSDPQSQQKLEQMQQQLKRLAEQLAELDDALYLQKELEKKAGLSEEEAKKLVKDLAKMDPKQLEKELQRQLADKGVSDKQIKELAKKFQQQQQAKQQCQNMSKALAQAAKALQQCNSPGSGSGASQEAAAALADAAEQMSNLEMTEQLANELEAQLAEMQSLRDNITKGGY